eukprot:SAG11_NODE_5548_length_1529_cov_1.529371_3_plen_65_part_00
MANSYSGRMTKLSTLDVDSIGKNASEDGLKRALEQVRGRSSSKMHVAMTLYNARAICHAAADLD